MARKKILKYFSLLPIVFFISLSLYFYFYFTPEKAVDLIGANNAYAFMFVLAFLGGLTVFSGIPYHLVLIVLAAGGPNPLLLGLSSTAGAILGDSTSYFLGYQGRVIAPPKVNKFFQRVYSLGIKYPRVFRIIFFLYGSFVPLSNDLITIPAGLARYPFWQVMAPLAAGNVIFNVSVAYLSVYAYPFLSFIF